MHQPFVRAARLDMADQASGDAFVTPDGFFVGDGTSLIDVILGKDGSGHARLRPEI